MDYLNLCDKPNNLREEIGLSNLRDGSHKGMATLNFIRLTSKSFKSPNLTIKC